MAIPKYDEMLLPLLRLISDGGEHAQRDLAEPLANHFELTPAERVEMLPKVRATYLRHRLGWAGFSLRRAGLAESPSTESSGSRTKAGNSWPRIQTGCAPGPKEVPQLCRL